MYMYNNIYMNMYVVVVVAWSRVCGGYKTGVLFQSAASGRYIWSYQPTAQSQWQAIDL